LTPICITGDGKLPALIQASLRTLGLPQDAALQRDPTLSLSSWHQKVMAQVQGQNTQAPARMWEQLAAELLLAQSNHAAWSWAEPESLHLLDFWAAFDHNIHFLLLADKPTQTLLRHMQANAAQAPNIAQTLEQWQVRHQKMLHFALRHPDRCQLIWADQAQQNPLQLAQHLAQQWPLDWTPQGTPEVTSLDTCPLAHYIALQALQQHPQAHQLQSDLNACIMPLGDHTHDHQFEPLTLLARYQQLKTDSSKTQALAQLQKQLQEAQAHNTIATAKHLAIQQELQASEAAKTNASQQAKDLQDKLKVAQAGQIQSASQAAELDKQLKATQSTGAAQLKDLQDKLKAAQAAQTQSASQAAELDKQLKATQSTSTAQLKDLQTRTEQQKQLEQAKTEAQEEADTLLVQLHETQEELESYCIQNDELQHSMAAYAALQKRWMQLFENHPDLFTIESLSISPVPEQSHQFQVHLQDLYAAGRHFESLDLIVGTEADGCASLTFVRPQDATGPLVRWPHDIPPGGQLTLHPGNNAETPAHRIATYLQLSTSDWQLAMRLPKILLSAVAQGITTINPSDQLLLQSALENHLSAIKPLRNILRFDEAQTTALPNSEQLALQLSQLGQDKLAAALTHISLERSSTSKPDSPFTLSVSPNTWLGNAQTCQISITPKGFKPTDRTQAPVTEDTLQRLRTLINMLPLALMDSVQHGANKNLLKPWAQTLRELRTWAQHIPTETEQQSPAKTKAPAKAKTSPHAIATQLPTRKVAAKASPTRPALKTEATTRAKPTPPAVAKPAVKPLAQTAAQTASKSAAKTPAQPATQSAGKSTTPPAAPRKAAKKPTSRKVKA